MKIDSWLADGLHRLFPLGKIGNAKNVTLLGARGERVSFQVGLRLTGTRPVEVSVEVKSPKDLSPTVRRVGCVPVSHFGPDTKKEELDGWGLIPGFVPDVLYPDNKALVAPDEVTSFWITVTIPQTIRPGTKEIVIKILLPEKRMETLKAVLNISKIVLERRKNFRVTHWFYPDALCDWYKVKPFSKEFWPICKKYMRNYADHGNDLIYVPAFTPPLDGTKRPTQLIGVTQPKKGKYKFDWKLVKQWIDLARKSGLEYFEWTHLFTQWGCDYAIRIYLGHGETEKLLWSPQTAGTSATYRNFLAQFLPALRKFLQQERLEEKSYFHISDEPHREEHLATYKKARDMVHELAPWMKLMDAVSDIRFGREGLTDIPIPVINTVLEYVQEKIPCWTYFACGPRGPYINRHLDTPLSKVRMTGWLLYRFALGGFLHWGYNYWYKSQTRQLIDPFTTTDGGNWPFWSHGDTFTVYPGPDGPLDSIRWEVFSESLQDYALLQTLKIDPNDKRLAKLKSFADFPKDSRWLKKMRKKLLFP